MEHYLQRDCYFTLGPDFLWKEQDELYQYMLRNIPDNRLFLETDGLDAVIWAYEEAKKGKDKKLSDKRLTELYTAEEYKTEIIEGKDTTRNTEPYRLLKNIMYENLQLLSACKKKKPKEMLFQLEQNLFDFLAL